VPTRFWVSLIALEGLWLLGAIAAHKGGMLTVSQMQSRGIEQGLPYLGHMGMWSDLILVGPVLAFLVAWYGDQWSLREWLIVLALGMAASFFMHNLWAKDTMIQSQVEGGRLTAAGLIHIPHMAIIVAILLLTAFFTKGVSWSVYGGVALVIAIHFFVGTHTLLKILRPAWFPQQSIIDLTTAMVYVGGALLILVAGLWLIARS